MYFTAVPGQEPSARGTDSADRFLCALAQTGHRFFTGVPCSLLKGLFTVLETPAEERRPELVDLRYVAAPREDSALGLACGVAAAGERPVVLMQNSGLGYSLNVLTSFNLIYEVPLLLVVSWRGHGGGDAIEHLVIGRELIALLDVFGLPHLELDHDRPEETVRAAVDRMTRTRRPAVILIRRVV